jgi:hypothetical protein
MPHRLAHRRSSLVHLTWAKLVRSAAWRGCSTRCPLLLSGAPLDRNLGPRLVDAILAGFAPRADDAA